MCPSSLRVPLATAFLLLVLAGCRDPKVKAYRVPKEPEPAVALPAAPDHSADLVWKTPPGWQQLPADGVRKASFLIASDDGQKADVSVTNFPGAVGGDLANVNRWRGQLQLVPLAESELPSAVTILDFPAGKISLVDLIGEIPAGEGKRQQRILGAWLKQMDRTWFFKMSGDAIVVGVQKNTFLDFLKTIERSTVSAGAPAPLPAPMAADVPGIPSELTWTAPAGWTAKPLGQMRKGSFTIKDISGAEADVSIIAFPGEAGGLAENLNRWRGQLQLPPLSAADLASDASTVADNSLRFTVVDYVGTGPSGPAHLLGAVLPLATETYFFKMLGPDPLVSSQKAMFLEFLKTVKTR